MFVLMRSNPAIGQSGHTLALSHNVIEVWTWTETQSRKLNVLVCVCDRVHQF